MKEGKLYGTWSIMELLIKNTDKVSSAIVFHLPQGFACCVEIFCSTFLLPMVDLFFYTRLAILFWVI